LKQVINCLKENNPYINKKLKEVTVDEGFKIAEELFRILNKRKDGIGLAANQVGIDASVAVVNVREPIILINPKIIQQWGDVPYYEGCLSFPKKSVQTKRFKNVIMTTEQEDGKLYFSGESNPIDGKGSWEKQEQNENDAEIRLLESICVQHEIDHLNGIVCMDRRIDLTVIREEVKIGRNDPCHCGSGKKYKKCCM
jgi:peptide deformylase